MQWFFYRKVKTHKRLQICLRVLFRIVWFLWTLSTMFTCSDLFFLFILSGGSVLTGHSTFPAGVSVSVSRVPRQISHWLKMLTVKHPGHSAKSAGGRLQLNTHAPYVCGFAWSDMVHGCVVYTERTETAAVSCGTSHAIAVSTPLRWIFKTAL